MIHIERKEDCVGCGACLDCCPKDAIAWQTDIEGFWYPKVDMQRCVDCGLCEKVCPVLKAGPLNETNVDAGQPTVLAAWNTDPDVRFASTTGGLFSALADRMLEQGGYIGGAVWTEDFGARHIVSNNPDDLLRIRGSKYFQSDSTGLYRSVRELLRRGEKVLVCGCPCQMAALRSFLRRDYENLIIVDFICCSINSPKLFRAYLDDLEKEYGAKVVAYHPKNKEYGGWHNFAFKATFANGKVYAKNRTDDDFTKCFIGTHIAGRPSCYECRFKSVPRIADITIADFWGIERVDSKMDSPQGTSLVLLNNAKGRAYYASLSDRVFSAEKTLKEAATGNSNLYSSLKPSVIDRKLFYELLDKYGFRYVMDRLGHPKQPFRQRIKGMLRRILFR